MKLKQTLTVICLFILFIFIINGNDIKKTTEVTITIPKLNSNKLTNQIKNEISQYKNIDFIEGSIESKTLVIRVDEASFNKSDIDKLLFKWGCNATNYYFRKLYNLELN